MALHQKLLDDLKPILLSPIYARAGEAEGAPAQHPGRRDGPRHRLPVRP